MRLVVKRDEGSTWVSLDGDEVTGFDLIRMEGANGDHAVVLRKGSGASCLELCIAAQDWEMDIAIPADLEARVTAFFGA